MQMYSLGVTSKCSIFLRRLLGLSGLRFSSTARKIMERPLKLLLDYDEAAQALSLSRAALRDLVYKGRGPTVTKIGRRTFFAVRDLEAFIDEHRKPSPTSTIPQSLPRKRRRGRPTIAEQMIREAAFRS